MQKKKLSGSPKYFSTPWENNEIELIKSNKISQGPKKYEQSVTLGTEEIRNWVLLLQA